MQAPSQGRAGGCGVQQGGGGDEEIGGGHGDAVGQGQGGGAASCCRRQPLGALGQRPEHALPLLRIQLPPCHHEDRTEPHQLHQRRDLEVEVATAVMATATAVKLILVVVSISAPLVFDGSQCIVAYMGDWTPHFGHFQKR